jgi:hypothetical protein
MEVVKKRAYVARVMIFPALVVALSFGPTPDPVETSEPSQVTASEAHVSSMTDRRVGGVVAPAAMPAGAMSLYAMLGAPELGGGFRQGFSMMELEVKLMFNYLLASGSLEIGLRFPVYEKGMVQMAPTVALGLEANSGSRYYDRANFAYVAVRPRVGFITSLRFSDTVAGLVLFDLPWSIAFTSQGSHVVPTVGAGAEVHLGGNMSGFVMANVGLDAIKEPLGVTQYRTGWALRLGLGFRLF